VKSENDEVIGVSLLLFGSLLALSVGIDLFQGTNVLQALYNALSPFCVNGSGRIICPFFSFVFLFRGVTLSCFKEASAKAIVTWCKEVFISSLSKQAYRKIALR